MVAVAERKNIRAPSIPIHKRQVARNCYVFRGMSAPQAAQASGLSVNQVKGLAKRYFWGKEKVQLANKVSASVDAQGPAMAEEADKAITEQCTELALTGISLVRETFDRGDKNMAKDAQALTASVRNLVTARNLVRGGLVDVGQSGNTQVNLFFFRPSSPATVERRAESVEVQATVLPATLPPATT